MAKRRCAASYGLILNSRRPGRTVETHIIRNSRSTGAMGGSGGTIRSGWSSISTYTAPNTSSWSSAIQVCTCCSSMVVVDPRSCRIVSSEPVWFFMVGARGGRRIPAGHKGPTYIRRGQRRSKRIPDKQQSARPANKARASSCRVIWLPNPGATVRRSPCQPDSSRRTSAPDTSSRRCCRRRRPPRPSD